MSTKQLDLLEFQDDITKLLNIEQYIKSEFDELNPREINPTKSYAIIKDLSIERANNKLIIKIIHNGKIYASKIPITKENIEYLCGLTNVTEFNVDEIIGSKINFTTVNNESISIKQEYSYKIGIPPFIMYLIGLIFANFIVIQIVNIYTILTCLAIAIGIAYTDIKYINKELENIFEFKFT